VELRNIKCRANPLQMDRETGMRFVWSPLSGRPEIILVSGRGNNASPPVRSEAVTSVDLAEPSIPS
jgi:hypothetical protein